MAGGNWGRSRGHCASQGFKRSFKSNHNGDAEENVNPILTWEGGGGGAGAESARAHFERLILFGIFNQTPPNFATLSKIYLGITF